MEQENFDFYQEALKAFDAPIPAPKKEEPEQEIAAEVTEPAAPEKPKRMVNPWWIVALCAILCLALLIGLNRKPEKGSRGENYVYGYIITTTDQELILNTSDGRWYVELNGLEAPEYSTLGASYLWVFYDGEPEEIDNWNCTKKITASYLLRYADKGKTDRIEFDLDGDGQKEIWSFTYSVAMQPVLTGWQSPRLNLKAQDLQGNTLYAASMDVDPDQCAVFNDAGGKLSLVQYNYGIYHALDIRLEHGELAIYRGKEPVTLYEPIVLPGDQPPITQPEPPITEPTPPPGLETSIRFNIPAGKSSVTKTLSPGDARVLQDQLDALNWTEADDVERSIQWIFYFVDDESQRVYNFCNGILKCGGKEAKIGTELTQKLMDMMGRTVPLQQAYQAYLSNGEMLHITFYDDGLARLKRLDKNGSTLRTYMGRFSSIHNHLYVLDVGEEQRSTLVLEWQEDRLVYLASHSEQFVFVGQDQLSFYDPSAGGSLSVSLRRYDGSWDSSSSPAVLTVQTLSALRQKLNNCDWKTGETYTAREIVARFILTDGVGENGQNPEQYWLLTSGRLLAETPPGGQDMIADIDPIMWHLLAGLFSMNGEDVSTVYYGTTLDGMEISLELNDNGLFTLNSQFQGETNEAHGYYSYLGEVIMLMGLDQDLACIFLDVRDRELVYNADYSTPNHFFGENREIVLNDPIVDILPEET